MTAAHRRRVRLRRVRSHERVKRVDAVRVGALRDARATLRFRLLRQQHQISAARDELVLHSLVVKEGAQARLSPRRERLLIQFQSVVVVVTIKAATLQVAHRAVVSVKVRKVSKICIPPPPPVLVRALRDIFDFPLLPYRITACLRYSFSTTTINHGQTPWYAETPILSHQG